MCIASAITRPNSAALTSGCRVTARKRSNASAPRSTVASARKCSGRKIASASPDSRCSSAARNPGCLCEARIMRDRARTRRAGRGRAAAPRRRRARASSERPRHAVHSRSDVAQADRRVDRDRHDEHDIERQEGAVAARAAEHVRCGEPAAHGVDDGREMHRHGERQHGRACALGEEENRAQRVLPSIRATMARLRPAIA